MACECGCSTEAPSPEGDVRPVAGDQRELERLVHELEDRVRKLETERAAA